MNSQAELITFSFGQNWRSFVDTISEGSIRSAMSDIERWFGAHGVKDRTILDIGSGSGIHSLCFHLMGAREVLSIDVDPKSVESTSLLRNKAGDPENWKVVHGSILDPDFVRRIKPHEIVYSWGVLHHTERCGRPSITRAAWCAPRGCSSSPSMSKDQPTSRICN